MSKNDQLEKQSSKSDPDENAERIKGYSSEKEAYRRLKQNESQNGSSDNRSKATK